MFLQNQIILHQTLRIFLIICLNLIPVTNIFAQKVSIYGYVLDKNSHETLPSANIIDSTYTIGTTTNQFGFFSMSLPAGRQTITASFAGYQPQKIEFSGKSDTAITFQLELITLKGVEIISSSEPASQSIGRVSIPIVEMKEMPVLMGETDILKSLAKSAGVSNGNEGTSGIFVRGGSADQNLILLDGATVYNTTHMFGFLSVFNPDAIKNVELFKGGFPAQYGGRLSSVIDVSMKEGNNKKPESSFSIGPLSAHFTTEGPISKGKSSYLFSGRAAYLGLLTLPTWFSFKSNQTDSFIGYYMYDVNLKYNYSPSAKKRLFVSMYLGNDKLQNKQHQDGLILNYPIQWGNRTFSVRYTQIINSAMFSSTHLNYNYYQFHFSFFEESGTKKLLSPIRVNMQSSVRDFSLKQQFDWNASPKHYVKFGIEAIQQLLNPDNVCVENISGLTDSVLSDKNNRIHFNTFSAFITDNYHFSKKIELEMGVRMAMYFNVSNIFLYGEPRLSLIVKQSDISAFKLSLSRMTQPVHLLSGGNSGLPNDIWLPSTKKIKPEKALQFSFGHNYLIRNGVRVTNEVFYKQLSDCIDYSEGANFMATLTKSWEKNVVSEGKGKVYGYELSFEKSTKKYRVQIAYTLMWNYRKFENINHGNWYPFKFDRRHDFSLSAVVNLNDKWKFSTNWVYMTGQAVTLPVAWVEDISSELTPVYIGRNQQRMPVYHRLDVAFLNSYVTKHGRDATFAVGVYNAYARRNPYALELYRNTVSSGSGTNQKIGFETKVEQFSLLGFMPYICYFVKFR